MILNDPVGNSVRLPDLREAEDGNGNRQFGLQLLC